VSFFKDALQLIITRHGYIRFAQVPERGRFDDRKLEVESLRGTQSNFKWCVMCFHFLRAGCCCWIQRRCDNSRAMRFVSILYRRSAPLSPRACMLISTRRPPPVSPAVSPRPPSGSYRIPQTGAPECARARRLYSCTSVCVGSAGRGCYLVTDFSITCTFSLLAGQCSAPRFRATGPTPFFHAIYTGLFIAWSLSLYVYVYTDTRTTAGQCDSRG